jgi:hypothetical protein
MRNLALEVTVFAAGAPPDDHNLYLEIRVTVWANQLVAQICVQYRY